MATHSSIVAWRIPWTESGGLQSTGLQRDMTEWLTHTHTHTHTLTDKTLKSPVFLNTVCFLHMLFSQPEITFPFIQPVKLSFSLKTSCVTL